MSISRTLRVASLSAVVGLMASAPAYATTLHDASFTPVGTSIPSFIGRIIRGIIGVVGILALVMFVYGGVSWMISAGNQERVSKAKKTVVWAAIGLIITLGAAVLVRFILQAIGT